MHLLEPHVEPQNPHKQCIDLRNCQNPNPWLVETYSDHSSNQVSTCLVDLRSWFDGSLQTIDSSSCFWFWTCVAWAASLVGLWREVFAFHSHSLIAIKEQRWQWHSELACPLQIIWLNYGDLRPHSKRISRGTTPTTTSSLRKIVTFHPALATIIPPTMFLQEVSCQKISWRIYVSRLTGQKSGG